MMRKLLCKTGLHRWQYTWIGPWNGRQQSFCRACSCCDKSEGLTVINPLSGPIKENTNVSR